MKRLKYKEFVPIGEELAIGEQINIDHEGCEAGYDTKQRLYIKRCEDGHTIIAYCHHCTKSGSYRDNFHKAKQARKVATSSLRRDNVDYARHIGANQKRYGEEWSARGLGWISKYGITGEECRRYGITYYPDEDRIVIPTQVNGESLGLQLRSLDPEDLPKYRTVCFKKPMFWYSGNNGNKLVITEDVLSAIKCTRAGVSALAILSSNMSDEVLEFISQSGHTDFIVFLDDDNKIVRRSQQRIKEKLELLGKARIIKDLGKDPKECSDEELEDILNEI